MSAAPDSLESNDTSRSAVGLPPAPDTVLAVLPHENFHLLASEEARGPPAAPCASPGPVLGATDSVSESLPARATEANTEMTDAAIETTWEEELREYSAVRDYEDISDLDSVGEASQFPEEVVSVADMLPGIDLAEVNRIWENEFDPLDLVKLHPGKFRGCSISDSIVFASGEMKSRRPKGELQDYPDLPTLLYYWSIYQCTVVYLFGSRNHQIGGLMSLHANRLIEWDHTYQWDSVLRYHIALHRQAIQGGVYNPTSWQSEDQCLVPTFFQAYNLQKSAPESADSSRASEGINFSIPLLPWGLGLLLSAYCLLFFSPILVVVAVMAKLGVGRGAAADAKAGRPARQGWSMMVAIKRVKPMMPPKPEPRGEGKLMTDLEYPNEAVSSYSHFPVHTIGLRGGDRQDESGDDDKYRDGGVLVSEVAAASEIKPEPGAIAKENSLLRIYTDGSYIIRTGIGVWFGDDDSRNVSEPLTGRQTIRSAELTAILRAIDIAPMHQDVLIVTDSKYSISCVTVWYITWGENGWLNRSGYPAANKDLVKEIRKKMVEREEHGSRTLFKWVKSHTGESYGNSEADRLAFQGARMRRTAIVRQ